MSASILSDIQFASLNQKVNETNNEEDNVI
jgi:hypothetical protein